jgi:cob(I)alamin adenosyltransferase
MLDYTISILEKVSFDSLLFSKELQKAIHSLTEEEIQKLEKWFFDYSKSHNELNQFKTLFLN